MRRGRPGKRKAIDIDINGGIVQEKIEGENYVSSSIDETTRDNPSSLKRDMSQLQHLPFEDPLMLPKRFRYCASSDSN
jgi:hypothetical protein